MEVIKKYSVEIIMVLLAAAVLGYFWVQESNKTEEPASSIGEMQVVED